MASDTIITLAGKFESALELQSYCDSQFKTITALQAKLQEQQGEIAHLKELLHGKVERLEVSPEQAICELQIKRLLETASHRELTLEETKRLDLLVKNLYIAKGQTGSLIADFSKLPTDEQALLQLVETEEAK